MAAWSAVHWVREWWTFAPCQLSGECLMHRDQHRGSDVDLSKTVVMTGTAKKQCIRNPVGKAQRPTAGGWKALCFFPRAASPNCYQVSLLNFLRNLFLHGCTGWKSKIKVSTWPCSLSESCREGRGTVPCSSLGRLTGSLQSLQSPWWPSP
jgi:hypothetical protein